MAQYRKKADNRRPISAFIPVEYHEAINEYRAGRNLSWSETITLLWDNFNRTRS